MGVTAVSLQAQWLEFEGTGAPSGRVTIHLKSQRELRRIDSWNNASWIEVERHHGVLPPLCSLFARLEELRVQRRDHEQSLRALDPERQLHLCWAIDTTASTHTFKSPINIGSLYHHCPTTIMKVRGGRHVNSGSWVDNPTTLHGLTEQNASMCSPECREAHALLHKQRFE